MLFECGRCILYHNSSSTMTKRTKCYNHLWWCRCRDFLSQWKKWRSQR